jgi:YVTN family beta-propeller protein
MLRADRLQHEKITIAVQVLLLALCAALLPALAAGITATLPTGATPYAMAANPVTNKTYVAKRSGSSVTVIDGATHATTTVAVGSTPYSLGVNAATNSVYVANFNSDSVSVIGGSNDTVIAAIPVGARPLAVAVNTLTNRIYVGEAPAYPRSSRARCRPFRNGRCC